MKINVSRTAGANIEPVGVIDVAAKTFLYAPEYLKSTAAYPISVSLPLRAEPFSEREFRPYFEGLLPEGDARKEIAAKLSIREGDYLGILSLCGMECIGDVVLGNEEPSDASYEDVSEKSLKEMFAKMPLLAESNVKTRMSLAGTRGKIGLARFDGNIANNGWLRPLGSAASTHILKVGSLPGMAELEYVCTETARACGLTVAQTSLLDLGATTVICSKRFDRHIGECGNQGQERVVVRLHQEDFCQALGLLPGSKYAELENGSLAAIANLLRDRSATPAMDVAELIKIACFNYIVGNCDNHLKNMSIQYGAQWAGFSLAPAYDIVNTAMFPRFARTMGVSIGGENDIDLIRAKHFATMSAEVGTALQATKRLCRNIANKTVEGIRAAVKQVEKDFPAAAYMADNLEEDIAPRLEIVREFANA